MRIHCPGCGASGELQRTNPEAPVACPRCGSRWFPEPFDATAPDQRTARSEDDPALHHSLFHSTGFRPGLQEVRCPRCLAVSGQPVSRLHLPAPCPACHFLVEFEPLRRPHVRPRRARRSESRRRARSSRMSLSLAVGVPLVLFAATGAWWLHGRAERQRHARELALARSRAAQQEADAQRAAAREILARARAERLALEALRRERARRRTQQEQSSAEAQARPTSPEAAEASPAGKEPSPAPAAPAAPPTVDPAEQRRAAEHARAQAAREAQQRKEEARRLAERYAPRRAALDAALAASGGESRLREAIDDALDWLVRHQSPDGSWSATGFARQCAARGCVGPDYRSPSRTGRGLGDPRFDVGLSSLGLLALLGDGHDPRVASSPERRDAARAALRFLLDSQQPDGSFGHDGREQTVYNHVLATHALAECAIATRDPALRAPLERAVQWLLLARIPDAGWGYNIRTGPGDTSVTCFAVLALWSARTAGLEIEPTVALDALRWIERCTARTGPAETRWLVGYRKPGDGGSQLNRRVFPYPPNLPDFTPVPGLTAAAVATRLLIGQQPASPSVLGGLRQLASSPPRWQVDLRTSSVDLVYAYWGSVASALADRDAAAPKHWRRWSTALEAALLGRDQARQRRKGDAKGCWDPVGAWGAAGGRVYATAMATLCLESWQLRASWRARLADTTLGGERLAQLEQRRNRRQQALRATVLKWLAGRKRYVCGSCGGRGRVRCRQCDGLGRERFGPVANQMVIRCRRCGGKGWLRCSRCGSRRDGLDPRSLARAEQRYGATGSPIRAIDTRSVAPALPLLLEGPVRVEYRIKLRGRKDYSTESSVWREDERGRWRIDSGGEQRGR